VHISKIGFTEGVAFHGTSQQPDRHVRPAVTTTTGVVFSDAAARIIKTNASCYYVPEVLYHGAKSEEAAKDIIENGFKRGNNQFEAVSLTPSFEEALDYAEGNPKRVVAVKK